MIKSKPQLYLHCGLPKTGTTAIQKFFGTARLALRSAGYDYPEIGICAHGTAHHNLPRQIRRDPSFRWDRGTLNDMLTYLGDASDLSKIIVSSEGFSACMINPNLRAEFIEFIRALKERSDLRAVFTLRRFVCLYESAYLSKQKTGTGYARPMTAEQAERWLAKFSQALTQLSDVLGRDKVVLCDVERKDSLKMFLSVLQANLGSAPTAPTRRNERVGLKKAVLLHRLQFTREGSDLTYFSPPEIKRVGRDIRKAAELPGEIYGYRVIPFEEANAIQDVARRQLPAFLMERIQEIVSPEPEPYRHFDLWNVELGTDEIDSLLAATPEPLVTRVKSCLSAHWSY